MAIVYDYQQSNRTAKHSDADFARRQIKSDLFTQMLKDKLARDVIEAAEKKGHHYNINLELEDFNFEIVKIGEENPNL